MTETKSARNMTAGITPLNGEYTHTLTKHARSVLSDIMRRGAIPTQLINPGVVNRFRRESLTETILMPSPFKTHKGALIKHEQITDAGRAALAGNEVNHG